jgi:hypothetical protein
MDTVLAFALTAMANPTLIGVTTLMLLLPDPKRLMLGYLAGALVTSITLGLVIVFAAEDSGVTSSAKHTVNPVLDLTIAGLLLVVAFVLHSGRDRRVRERRAARKAGAAKEKKTPRWQRALSKGDPKLAFVVGMLLTLPGASYLAALASLSKLDYSTAGTVAVVLLINVIMLALLEVPLVSFAVAPEATPVAIERVKAWFMAKGRSVFVILATVVALLLIVRALIVLIA